MRFSPILLISAMFLASATALAVPFVLHPIGTDQKSLPSESLAPSALSENISPRKTPRQGGVLQTLDLTRDQFLKISAVRKQYQPLIQSQALTVKTLQAKLRSQMAGSAEPSEVTATFQQLQKQRQELQQLRFDSSLATRQLLTPTQRKAFETELDKRRLERHAQK